MLHTHADKSFLHEPPTTPIRQPSALQILHLNYKEIGCCLDASKTLFQILVSRNAVFEEF